MRCARWGCTSTAGCWPTSPGALSALSAVAVERGVGVQVALFHTVRLLLVLLSIPALVALAPD